MEECPIKTRRKCPLCPKGRIIETFCLRKKKASKGEVRLGQCIMTNPSINDIKSLHHHCGSCGALFKFKSKLKDKNLNRVEILNALKSEKDILVEDVVGVSKNLKTKIFKKGSEVYRYTDYFSGPRSSSLNDPTWKMDAHFIATKPKGPYWQIRKDH